MADVELTKYQEAAVNNQGGTLLVSAAAGSGKTKVLVTRMLHKVMEQRLNIDDFLIITFTRAAAAELRGKIISQLSELLSEHPQDRHLQQQLSRVYLAQISTVHGFCSNILREYAHQLDLSPDFRVCEESEAKRLRDRVMTALLDEAYTENDPDISATLDILGAGRDDGGLAKIIDRCYDCIQNTRNTKDTFEAFRQMLVYSRDEDLSKSIWGKHLIEEFRYFINESISLLERAIGIINATEELGKYYPAFSDLVSSLRGFANVQTWDEIRTIPYSVAPLSRITKCSDIALKEQVQSIRKKINDKMKKWLLKFSAPSNEAVEDLCRTAPALRGLLQLTEEFAARFRAEKDRKRMMDYGDLEQQMLRLLYGGGTKPTAAAREIGERYAELMIDEYQDSNAIQDAIYYAISDQGKNLFFVGDVKQSIYRFRNAEPKIFTEKYLAYLDYTEAAEGEPRKILLSDNFRSSKAILSAANDVFYLTMNARVGGVDYSVNEALRPGRRIPPTQSPAVELHCIEVDKDSLKTNNDPVFYEAEFVARRIKQLIDGETLPTAEGSRSIQPEDIVILMRSPAQKAATYQQALAQYGIRSLCSSDNLFDTEEITFLYSLLQVIDNPHQDIPLLSVLLSPVIRFSPDELAMMRSKNKLSDLYDLLRQYASDSTVLRALEALREIAQQGSVRELLDEIENLLSLRSAFPLGQYHLDMMLTIADQFESGTQFGLSAFLQHLEALKEKGPQIEDVSPVGSVRISTIHRSKGLEYPVVFLADLCKQFNATDYQKSLLMDEHFGLATKFYDPKRFASYPTVALHALSDYIMRESLSEEMRILYVAMTRPQHRLIMSCCAEGLGSRIADLATGLSEPVSPSQIEGARSLSDWILMTALTHTESGCLYQDAVAGRKGSEEPWSIAFHNASDFEQQALETEAVTQTVDPPAFCTVTYSHGRASLTPSKLTATQLKGRALDDEVSDSAAPPIPHFYRPNFHRKTLSATDRGTAIHLAMQYLDYSRCTTQEGIVEELDRLLSQRFLNEEQRKAIPPQKLLRFFHSELGKRILNADQVIREFKFSILEDANSYDSSLVEEALLLQGVTDCCIIENGMLSIIDFKSDRLSPGEEAQRAEYYRGQVDAYSRALSRIFDCLVKERILYFFATDTACVV